MSSCAVARHSEHDRRNRVRRALEPHRRELHVHCYRMLGSFDEAEDRSRRRSCARGATATSFDGGATVARVAVPDRHQRLPRRDPAAQRGRVPRRSTSLAEVPWLQPYPGPAARRGRADRGRSRTRSSSTRETIELAFLAAIQLLPPRQRAALILRDVLGWSAKETAELLETSVAAVNSALQRAGRRCRSTCPRDRGRDGARRDAERTERDLLARFIDAHERGDAAAAPRCRARTSASRCRRYPWLYDGHGRDAAAARSAHSATTESASGGSCRRGRTGCRRRRATCAGRATTEFRAFKLDVLRVEGGRIAEITTFGAAAVRGVRPAGDALVLGATSSAMSHGSRTSRPSGVSSYGAPAAITRSRRAAASAAGSTTVQWRRPTVPAGAGGTPRPRQTLKPRWWW